ncbi:MAG: flavodoxin-dependent (E)-4-hydroxy-3-methylbut-2-enyl-diphosphate synthase [Candidatus Moranbacteria bacterium]|nr:flavodoxin-dependent (E)-4-hydroxy-3-methylbut-2-enyl-diphosphate synthase [Candidatus Moranbacteria bacterium]
MKKTRKIKVGSLVIGGGRSKQIVIQSMTNTRTKDLRQTLTQIKQLENAGCELVRVAVLDQEDAKSIFKLKKQIGIPLVADIHFDYKLALLSLKSGADKIRINPGNLGRAENLKKVVDLCRKINTPIRIGVNSGSIEKEILNKYKKPTAEALAASALKNLAIVESLNFDKIVLSMKHSDVLANIKAYELVSQKVDYPLHLGLTEAGTFLSGAVKSSVTMGVLLHQGIGDTLRISLSGDPVQEIGVAKKILKALNLSKDQIEIISCPTCGRTTVDVEEIASRIEEATTGISKDLSVAVMGCLVNGPGEAKRADLGVSGIDRDNDYLMFFKKGKTLKKIHKNEVVNFLIKEIAKF